MKVQNNTYVNLGEQNLVRVQLYFAVGRGASVDYEREWLEEPEHRVGDAISPGFLATENQSIASAILLLDS